MNALKILTLNAHSLIEENHAEKRERFVEFVLQHQPDLIALQEVNQTADAPGIDPALLRGMVSLPSKIPFRSDNHAAWTAHRLMQAGLDVSWAWLPVKISYDRYDEGLALLSLRGRLCELHPILLSRSDDYANWRTRMALGARIEGMPDRFYTTHMGWWNDAEEPFLHQWESLHAGVDRMGGRVWLTGDFNSPAEVRGEGYDRIRADGWHDAWLSARETRGEKTVEGVIDGWRSGSESPGGMRIDHIWCSRPVSPRSAKVVFDGVHEPQVSDHYGILLEI